MDQYPIYFDDGRFSPRYVHIDDEDSVTLDGCFTLADLEEIIHLVKQAALLSGQIAEE